MKRLSNELCRLDFMLTNEFKSSCSFFLSLIAIACFIINPIKEQKICMYAIFVSTLADLVLMDYHGISSFIVGNKRFYVGMLVFAIAHILYIVCFSTIFFKSNVYLANANFAMIATLTISFVTIFLVLKLSEKKKPVFRIAALTYTIIICLDLASIYICADLLNSRYILAAVGITLFLISDVLILIRETTKDTNLIRKLIWIFYPLGQLLIIFNV